MVEDLPSAELKPRILRLQWSTCLWAEHSDDYIYIYIYTVYMRRREGTSGFLIWSKSPIELIFKPCGEFRWSPEGPVNQIHSPHLHVGAPGIFSDVLRSIQMPKWTGSYRMYLSLENCNLGSWVCNGRPAFEQNSNLGCCVCSERYTLGQNTLMMM